MKLCPVWKKNNLPDFSIEKTYNQNVIGLDEVGRGPLAGPVFAAAVILDDAIDIKGLDDSKKISAIKRELIAREIQETALSWSIGLSTAQEIDEINILKASLLAMKRAIEGLDIFPDIALIDGQYAPKTKCKVQTIIRGDQSKKNIMAASILAKVGNMVLNNIKVILQRCI